MNKNMFRSKTFVLFNIFVKIVVAVMSSSRQVYDSSVFHYRTSLEVTVASQKTPSPITAGQAGLKMQVITL